ncbi:unnamed protein product [Knipowitschia caucasica]|uniref:C2H2-type domain-containing protein n=1 Tax=Knipowitschia caucasica TaxID=637954 RepID=A0AAV2LRL9_KNICA
MTWAEDLRALVTARLTAAAEDICALVERSVERLQEERGPGRDYHSPGRGHQSPGKERAEAAGRSGAQFVSALSPAAPETQFYIKEDPDLSIKQEPEELTEALLCTWEYAPPPPRRDDAYGAQPQTSDRHEHLDRLLGAAETSSGFENPQRSLEAGHSSALTKKLHTCAQCGKSYAHKPSLFRHIHTHKGQKPFQCSVCDKRFTQKPHLNKHMRTHTGEKPYCCPFCAKTFTDKSSVTQHLRVHTGD